MTNQMYIGPTLRGVIKHGTVYSGGLPVKLAKLAEKKPIIKNLIIPISKVAEAVRLSNEEGTAVAVAYDRISALSETEIKNITEGA